jgi:hypothetical protein
MEANVNLTDPLTCPTNMLGVYLPGLPHKSFLDPTPIYRDLRRAP